MYKEMRKYGSTPQAWANPFFKSYISLIHTLKIHLLTRDIRWRQIAQRLPKAARVLDAGCGMGEWVVFMSKKGLHPCGLDFSGEMISFLKLKHPEQEWKQGIVQDMPFPSDSFDAVIAWGVIEHDESGPQKALKEFHRILKVGGRLFVTVPIGSPAQRQSSALQFNKPGNETFFQYFMTPDELKDFIYQAGFEFEIVRPSGRHYALIFPGLYRCLTDQPPLLSRVTGLLFKPILAFRDEAVNLILAVARKL